MGERERKGRESVWERERSTFPRGMRYHSTYFRLWCGKILMKNMFSFFLSEIVLFWEMWEERGPSVLFDQPTDCLYFFLYWLFFRHPWWVLCQICVSQTLCPCFAFNFFPLCPYPVVLRDFSWFSNQEFYVVLEMAQLSEKQKAAPSHLS